MHFPKEISTPTAVIILLVVAVVLVLFGTCPGGGKRDGYMRSNLAEQAMSFHRSPVDYDFKSPGLPTKAVDQPPYIFGNPHYITEPKNKYHELDAGGVDLYADERKLQKGTLWDQYAPDYPGNGKAEPFLPLEHKVQSMITEIGQLDIARDIREHTMSPRYGATLDGATLLQAQRALYEDPYQKDHRIQAHYVPLPAAR